MYNLNVLAFAYRNRYKQFNIGGWLATYQIRACKYETEAPYYLFFLKIRQFLNFFDFNTM